MSLAGGPVGAIDVAGDLLEARDLVEGGDLAETHTQALAL
jgi:hypothetical protein